MQTNTFSIDFFPRQLKRNKTQSCLFARITVNSEEKEISLKEVINHKDWESKSETVKGKTEEIKGVNEHIDNVRFKIREAYRLLQDKSYLITAQDVKDAYLGVHFVQNINHTLCKLITYHFEQMDGKLKLGTLKNYYATEAYVKNFIEYKYKRKDIILDQLNFEFITELETYIPKHPIKNHDKCTANGTAKHIERVKKMVKWAKKLKWIKTNPFEDFTPHRVKVHKPKLKMQYLMVMQKAPLLDEKLSFVKDIFEFSCYTGLAYADLMAVTPEDFMLDNKGNTWCIYHRKKSNETAGVPLLKRALEIFGKYKDDPRSVERGTIFPYLTNQEVNRSLKVIQEIYGIPLKLTFHVARHTFATTMMLKSGVPLETVSKMLGHSKISTTQIYAEVDQEKIEQDMAQVEQKLVERQRMLKAV